MGCKSFDVVRLHRGSLLQGQIRVAKLKSAFGLLTKNAVYLLNFVSWPLSVDTSCIWPQIRPWSSFWLSLPRSFLNVTWLWKPRLLPNRSNSDSRLHI